MTSNTKLNIIKYSFLISSVLYAVFMFFRWFDIYNTISGSETHSFLTIPTLINDSVETFKSYAGAPATFTILLFAGTLEYLCIVGAALGIWGVIRTLMKRRRSRLLLSSQIISLCLVVLALLAIVIINVISNSHLTGLVSISPTLGLLMSVLFLVVSIVTGIIYRKMCVNIRREERSNMYSRAFEK
ncbi:MAG: hypothetical protein IKJ68_08405 [Clostridia bacterium]|nr:hypothetical protein [Clostridia bacterium]